MPQETAIYETSRNFGILWLLSEVETRCERRFLSMFTDGAGYNYALLFILYLICTILQKVSIPHGVKGNVLI